MYFLIYESSRATLRTSNMFLHFTWLSSNSKIARELVPDMVPKLWDPDTEENRSMCAEFILERRDNEQFDKASAGISIRLLFN